MSGALFFRLVADDDKASTLSEAVDSLQHNVDTPDVYVVEPSSFEQVPGSPFAYWVSEAMRRKFRTLPKFEGEERTVRQGLATTDDFRFVRGWWESPAVRIAVSREETYRGKCWVAFAKGGEYSPYYADIHLLVNWAEDGAEIKEHICFRYPYLNGNWGWVAKNTDFYFRSGLTWPLRTHRLAIQPLVAGTIISVRGSGIFAPLSDLAPIAGLLSSCTFDFLVKMLLGRFEHPQFDMGDLSASPFPHSALKKYLELGPLYLSCLNIKRCFDTSNESSRIFHLPALLQTPGETLARRIEAWERRLNTARAEIARNQAEIDETAYELYDISEEDRRVIEASIGSGEEAEPGTEEGMESRDQAEETAPLGNTVAHVSDLVAYAIGCIVGRWDVRITLDLSLTPELADPFAPLPLCSPGMLVGPDGLPGTRDDIVSEEWLRARPDAITLPALGSVQSPTIPDSEYPLNVNWDGILVDDPDHPDDIVRRVRQVLEFLWGERADAIAEEACDFLSVKDLRTYFRNPRQFFDHHIGRYSKSRRKAPIYWLLQSPKRSFGLWLYYHRLDPDILFKALHKLDFSH